MRNNLCDIVYRQMIRVGMGDKNEISFGEIWLSKRKRIHIINSLTRSCISEEKTCMAKPGDIVNVFHITIQVEKCVEMLDARK